MTKNNVVVITFSTLLMIACSSLQKVDKKNIDIIQQFDLIELGQTKDAVTKAIGAGSDSKIKMTEELWFYKDGDADRLLRGTVVFDPKTQKVIGVTIIPREIDKELQLEFLKKVKFPSLVFEKIPLRRCGRDFYPQEEFYVNTTHAVIIEFNFHRLTVESYARSSPQYALEFAEKLKNCQN